jgi:hypothetical protein
MRRPHGLTKMLRSRGNSVTVMPMQSTTYTLYATNAFGRTTATINITVQ